MHRLLMVLALLGAFVVGSVGSVVAQDATPEGPAAGPGGEAGGDPAVGEPAIYVNEQGDEAAQVTVDEIIDPFEDYDQEFTEPERGTRFVAVRITVEATGEDAVEVSTFDFLLQDSQGFLASSPFLSRTEEQEEADPELEDANLAPGDSVSGLLFFMIFEENGIDHILWQPDSGRLITVAAVS
jgi:hypothetical protein